MSDWEKCEAVERDLGETRRSLVVQRNTRSPYPHYFEFLEWYEGVDRHQVQSVPEHELRSLAESIAT